MRVGRTRTPWHAQCFNAKERERADGASTELECDMHMTQPQQTVSESVAPLAADFEAIGRRVRSETLKAVAMHFSDLSLRADVDRRGTQDGADHVTKRVERDRS